MLGLWGPNLGEFQRRLGSPEAREHVENLYFAYLFVLRAVMKAGPLLETIGYDTGGGAAVLGGLPACRPLGADRRVCRRRRCSRGCVEGEGVDGERAELGGGATPVQRNGRHHRLRRRGRGQLLAPHKHKQASAAAAAVRAGVPAEDLRTSELVRKLVNSQELQKACPMPFDEGRLWRGEPPCSAPPGAPPALLRWPPLVPAPAERLVRMR
jgi:hypothetical protein